MHILRVEHVRERHDVHASLVATDLPVVTAADYWQEISEALAPARAILLLGHGNSKANASHQWVAYAEKHHKDVAPKVVADLRADIDDLTSHQVVQLAHRYFTFQRDWGDW